jgi:hypothetical protein
MNPGPHCFWAITGLAALAINGGAQAAEANPLGSLRTLYAVNQAAETRGSIAVYDIDAGHRLLKTIQTVSEVHNVKGVAASAVTGKLYVSYYDRAGVGMVYCLDLAHNTILWNRKLDPGVDRLAIHPDGQLLYGPTGEDNTADHINVVDANTGEIVRKVYFSKRSHDTQYPLPGPLFQETKAEDGSGNYLYQIDPKSYAVSRVGPYSGVLGPYAVDSASHYVVNDVTGLWGMQVADLKTGRIATAELAKHPGGSPGLMARDRLDAGRERTLAKQHLARPACLYLGYERSNGSGPKANPRLAQRPWLPLADLHDEGRLRLRCAE